VKFFAILLAAASMLCAQRRVPVIFDTDIGDDIDDALALALALGSPELDVRAVTTVADDVESRTRLAWKELGVFGRRDIALAMGAPEPLADPIRLKQSAQFKILTMADVIPEAARTPAAVLMIETLRKSPQPMTLIAVGPLTNIALALKLYPSIKEKIERIVLMGGAYTMAKPEYNIDRDRVAARIVFDSGVPITAVGLDVTLQCKMRQIDLNRLRAGGDPRTQFLMRLISLWSGETQQEFPILHDALAVAVAARPDLIQTAGGHVSVVEGVTKFSEEGSGTTRVATQVDAGKFLEMFVGRVTGKQP
jgi:purine nucleosidase